VSSSLFDDDHDVTRIIVKPLYFGLFVNVLIPAGLMMVGYYLDQKHSLPNRIGDAADVLFYVFVAAALLEGGAVMWLRKLLFDKPMIRRMETFEDDFTSEYLKRSRSLFVLIASISVYGFIYFVLTGRFKEMVLFVLLSFVIFQLVRPRQGLTRKLIAAQKHLAERGELLRD
jgi:hypothetical protein